MYIYILNNVLFTIFGLAFSGAIFLADGYLKNPSKTKVKKRKRKVKKGEEQCY